MRTKAIHLQPDEDALLRTRYLHYKIPSDQFSRRPDELRLFVRDWNALSGRHDKEGELLHYIKTKRKKKQWVTFDGDHKKQPRVPLPQLDDSHRPAFDEIYTQLNAASDHYPYNPHLAKRFAQFFESKTGISLSVKEVQILMLDRRKQGLLPKLEHPELFTDLDQLEQKSA
jgi:hypothetical protein